MRYALIAVVTVALPALLIAFRSSGQASNQANRPGSPVLVELFTSEGCSSCPPADALLQQLDAAQEGGNPLIVLSEHVDYWNHIGWKDPYSSSFFSRRQSAYAHRFGLDSVYTPQMVIDGGTQFVGSDSQKAENAIQAARGQSKIPVRVTALLVQAPSVLTARVEAGPSDDAGELELYAALALNHAESNVAAGENSGRRLTHVGVVKALTKIGKVSRGEPFAQDIHLKIDAGADARNLRLIVFAQQPGQGKILGSAMQKLDH